MSRIHIIPSQVLLVEVDSYSLELGRDGGVPHPVGKDSQEEIEDCEAEQNLH